MSLFKNFGDPWRGLFLMGAVFRIYGAAFAGWAGGMRAIVVGLALTAFGLIGAVIQRWRE